MNVEHENISNLKRRKARIADLHQIIKLLLEDELGGTRESKSAELDENYIIPFGKGRIVQNSSKEKTDSGESLSVITYGMGVHWALNASKNFPGCVEIVDLRTLNPLDEEMIFESVKRHGKCIVITEEKIMNSFAESLAGRISKNCFRYLDAPVEVIGSVNMPAVPLNTGLESEMLPNAEKVSKITEIVLGY